jgi:hypothetical protein
MARLDAAMAAGYDPDAEFRSMLGRLTTDDGLEDAAELDKDGSMPKDLEGQPESATPDLDAEFNEQLSEEERREEQESMNPVRQQHLHTQHVMQEYPLPLEALFRVVPFRTQVSSCAFLLHLGKPLKLLCVLVPQSAGLQAGKAAALAFLWRRQALAWQQQPADYRPHHELCISQARLMAGISKAAVCTGVGC